MSKILRGQRYLTTRNARLAKVIADDLPFMDHKEALRFYNLVRPYLRDEDVALLGCNDRFFLLVGVMGRTDANHPWIYDRCREVEENTDGYLDLWSRAHYKSSVITFAGSIQEVLANPEITIAIFSFNSKSARKFLGQIKQEFERNTNMHRFFPDVCWKSPRREAPVWSLDKGLCFKRRGNPKEQTIEAHGLVDGMPTGGHWQLLIYDDVITEKFAKNPEMVRKATEQWEMSDNLGIGDGTRKWHIGTRYSFGDSYSIMLQRGIKPRIYAATDNGQLDGVPVFLSPKRWAEIKNTQRSTVAAQMLQNPLAGSENTFRWDWFKGWEVRPRTLNVYIMCDPQKGSSRTSDRTAIAVVGVDSQGVKYLLDGFRHRMPLSDRWTRIRDLYVKWSRMPGVSICRVGYERYGAMTDEDYIREQMRMEDFSFELVILNWTKDGTQSKKDRVERLEPDFRRNRFLLPSVVYEHGQRMLWRFDDGQFKTMPLSTPGIVGRGVLPQFSDQQLREGGTTMMKRAIEHGQGWLVARPITAVNEDGEIYDVTKALIDEMLYFPFAPKDDLVDAVSRIYDMGVMTPAVGEDREAARLNSVENAV